ncbi:MAG: DUF3649 domain-containing protein [Parahaliea sp.]
MKTPAATQTSHCLTRYRIMIFLRFLLACVGGYILAALTAIVTARLYPAPTPAAGMSATLLAFCVYCGVFIWVFMVNSTRKAWLGVIIPIAVLALLTLIIKGH